MTRRHGQRLVMMRGGMSTWGCMGQVVSGYARAFTSSLEEQRGGGCWDEASVEDGIKVHRFEGSFPRAELLSGQM